MSEQDRARWGAVAVIVYGTAAAVFPFAYTVYRSATEGQGLSIFAQPSESAMNFVGVFGRLLILAAMCSWHRTGGFDPSRIILIPRNELLFYSILNNIGFYISALIILIFAIIIVINVIIELVKIFFGFLLLISLLFARPPRRRWW